MTVATAEHLREFETAVVDGDGRAALTLVERLLHDGVDPLTLLVDVVAEAQRNVGQRWLSGEWSVAQEHAATAVATSALEWIGRLVSAGQPTRGSVVMACAEHEWHAMAALLVATSVRIQGWEVTVLGASTPTARLSRFLQDLGPDVTAISCSVPAGLPQSRAFIEASTAAGIPVLAGGAAFGPDARRAAALGATGWAPDARSAVDALETMPRVVRAVAPLPPEVSAEQTALAAKHRGLVASVLEHWQPHATDDEVLEVAAETVNQTIYALVGTLITGDGRLLRETAAWVEQALTARGLSAGSTAEIGRHLGAQLSDRPLAGSLLTRHWP